MTRTLTAIPIPPSSAKAIATGNGHTCAILNDDTVKCWGLNYYGELGYDDTTYRGNTPGSMAALGTVYLGAGRTAKAITVGGVHTCVILDDKSVKCWGDNDSGQLGYDDTARRGNKRGDMAALMPVNLGVGRSAKAIATGNQHTCAILDDNNVKCWGSNNSGQLGYDSTTYWGDTAGSMATLETVNLGTGRSAKAIAVGNTHTCVILDNNSVKCWGANSVGQLGYGDTTDRGDTVGSMTELGAVNLGSGRSALSITTGDEHTCVILDDNSVKCWGANSFGQLGYGDTTDRGDTAGGMAALGAVNLGSGRSAQSIVAGPLQTCAILDNNTVKCWGRNTDAQLGYDDKINRGDTTGSVAATGAVNLGVGRTAKGIAIGSNHTCAMLDDNSWSIRL
jgi:alpha-tubulin suppressor-like RCC1 family protein